MPVSQRFIGAKLENHDEKYNVDFIKVSNVNYRFGLINILSNYSKFIVIRKKIILIDITL